MKRILFSLLCLSAFLFNVEEAKATHIAGGDITYRYIGDSTGIPFQYEIYLTLYRRDHPNSASLGPTQPVDIESSCGNSTLTVNRYYNPGDSLLADGGIYPHDFAPCVDETSPAYTDNKISQHNYKGVTTLPGKCQYTFSWQRCCRNSNITNLDSPGGRNLYLESTLDNTIGPSTSAQFLNPGAKSFCVNQFFTWSQAASEPDGDSIRFTIGQPWEGQNAPIPWAPGFSTTQPMTTANGFNFNAKNGLMTFTPTAQEVDVIKFVVEEYRFDTTQVQWRRIGTAIREVQVPVIAQCNELMETGVKITQGITTGNVQSTTETHNRDSLKAYFGIDSLANSVVGGGGGGSATNVEIDIIGYECYDSIITVQVDGDLKCSTVDPLDFVVIGPDGDTRPVIGAETNCQSTLLTDSINLILHKPLDVNGDYLLQIKPGMNDSTTIENECGFGVKDFFALIVRVENCPDLDYGLENVTVMEDSLIQLDWYAVDTSYNAKLFNQWNIWRARRENPFYVIDEIRDHSARSYVDSSVTTEDVDRDYFRYAVQLIQNHNPYTSWTNRVHSILLTDTMYQDSSGFEIFWTEYYRGEELDSIDSFIYELFIAKQDTSEAVIDWRNYEGPDSNFYTSEFIFPEEFPTDTLGVYLMKVEARDSLNMNPYVSESNWIIFEIIDPDNPNPEDPVEDLVIPNVLTPNGDQTNDVFALKPGPYGRTNDEIHISIYNRWGKQVHEFHKPTGSAYDETQGWKGEDMNTGNLVSDGVYYYIIRLTDGETNTTEEIKGHITVVGGIN